MLLKNCRKCSFFGIILLVYSLINLKEYFGQPLEKEPVDG